ncbi:gliding motility lipoprotein GldH [Mucilaginibacter terrae]|uniref:Gliding motility-associated lipoprotein GldH n=1 Tax=Mucilaginibacter terrae TaxID=1955052 RepID=A0ABU3GUR1_9SPHI|nr:gliding motility lipoprotein GldH [Mucilaginibacter terrae]MDT3403513.1 gliding motility-associated lipoprotein GldH [Mucilaginibacter terrae]
MKLVSCISNTNIVVSRNKQSFRNDIKRWFVILLFGLITIVSSCTDPGRIMDENRSVANHNWSYGNKIKFDVQIDDPAIAYNLYFNLRVTADYRYSNMFVLLYEGGPGIKKAAPTRFELKLASPTGEWLGKGSGSMYSYQIPFKTNYRFPTKGRYHFEIEQNMRDNPLRAVNDVGLRVAKAQ